LTAWTIAAGDGAFRVFPGKKEPGQLTGPVFSF
jgi:hypothetical protein